MRNTYHSNDYTIFTDQLVCCSLCSATLNPNIESSRPSCFMKFSTSKLKATVLPAPLIAKNAETSNQNINIVSTTVSNTIYTFLVQNTLIITTHYNFHWHFCKIMQHILFWKWFFVFVDLCHFYCCNVCKV